MNVLTRSFDSARTGANTQETQLTPQNVGSNLLVKRFSIHVNDDPRIEAQPLFVAGVKTPHGTRNVLYVCTMANNVWAFDADTGQTVWGPVNLGRPIKPTGNEIDIFEINILWGILSTPVIDLETGRMYVVCWTSQNGSVQNAVHQLHALDIATGHQVHQPIEFAANAGPQGRADVRFLPSHGKQRAALLLTRVNVAGQVRKTVFAAFSVTHEEHDPSHGWILACDVDQFRQTAAWCTTPNGSGCGIWQAGAGIAGDAAGDLYVMTGNYGVEDAHGNSVHPAAGDLPDSFVKLHYTPPADAHSPGKLEAVAWFTPFFDADRPRNGDDDFQDYDLGSAGPILLPGMGFVLGAGKDGVVYVLDQDSAHFGKGSDFKVMKGNAPIFFTYFPGFGIDASKVANLNHLFDGKTHHLHTNPLFWHSPDRGPMLFCWGENENLRAWTIAPDGTITFVAKGAEVASAGVAGKGGMPGGMLALSANGNTPNTGIVWSLAPISGDANKHVVAGILRAYDASKLDPVPNADGTPRLKLLWDSLHIPNNHFSHCKFCPPVVANGQIFVPTYDGRVDVYGLVRRPHRTPVPTNAKRVDTPGMLPSP